MDLKNIDETISELERVSGVYRRALEALLELKKEMLETSTESEKDLSILGEKEKQILDLMGDGLDMHEIALKLKKSKKTVEAQRNKIREKLQLSSAYDVKAYALKIKKRRPDL